MTSQRTVSPLTHIAFLGTCGGLLSATDTPKNLTSPGYPNHYPHGLNCRWLVAKPFTAASYEQIAIDVLDLGIEGDAQCQHDYLELRDQPMVSRVW